MGRVVKTKEPKIYLSLKPKLDLSYFRVIHQGLTNEGVTK